MHEHPFGENAYTNLQNTLKSHQSLLTLDPDDHHIELITNPWMGCSYWDVEDRHQIKRTFNQLIQKWLDKKLSPGLKKRMAANAARTGKVKRIVVASEKYKSNHAMYRCYHSRIQALRSEYELILVSAPGDYDETSAKDFDLVIEIADGAKNITDTAKEVVKLEPDMIFFPSLGMAKWTVLLANLRIARYQVMAYGHPASAFSQHIDFGIQSASEMQSEYQKHMTEELIPIYQRELSYSPHPSYDKSLERKSLDDGVVRVAINSALAKISPRVVNLCKILSDHSDITLQFQFFMVHNRSLKILAFEKHLRRKLGDKVLVHAPSPYDNYMRNLAQCDLAIGTFPFGGSNTNVDLLLLGIPKIFYTERSDLASYTDLRVMNNFQLPKMLHAKSEAELLASSIYLIHNRPERESISKIILDQSPWEVLFSGITEADDSNYLSAFKWIENKES